MKIAFLFAFVPLASLGLELNENHFQPPDSHPPEWQALHAMPLLQHSEEITTSPTNEPRVLDQNEVNQDYSPFWAQCQPSQGMEAKSYLRKFINQALTTGPDALTSDGTQSQRNFDGRVKFDMFGLDVESCATKECQEAADVHFLELSEKYVTLGVAHVNKFGTPHWQEFPECIVIIGNEGAKIWIHDRMVDIKPHEYVQINSKAIHMVEPVSAKGFDMLYWYHKPKNVRNYEGNLPETSQPELWDKAMAQFCSERSDSVACKFYNEGMLGW